MAIRMNLHSHERSDIVEMVSFPVLRVTRRSFLKTAALATAGAVGSARSWSQVAGANGDIRLAIAGLNGRGKELAAQFPQIPGVRVVAFCDCDTAVLDRELAAARSRGQQPDTV